MKRLVLALTLFGTALGANAALFLRDPGSSSLPAGQAQIDLGRLGLSVPRALIRDRAQMAGGRLDRLDLAVNATTFLPLPPATPHDPTRPLPERLSIILAPARGEPLAVDLFQTVHARFLTREAGAHPGGLVVRRFRQGTPYEDRELYLGVGGGRPFVALCPLETHRETEPCTTSYRIGELDAELRFHARHLPEWRRLMQESAGLVESLMPPGG